MRRALIAVALVGIATVALNVAGVLRYPGGPLSRVDNPLWLDIPPVRLGIKESADAEVGQQMYVTVYVRSRADSTVTLESLEAVDATDGVQSVAAYRLLPGSSDVYALGPWGEWPSGEPALAPLPVQLGTADPATVQLLLVVRPTIEGDFMFSGARLHYRIGPMSFTTTLDPIFYSCAHAVGAPDCRDLEATF
jgi:hypothetical protein